MRILPASKETAKRKRVKEEEKCQPCLKYEINEFLLMAFALIMSCKRKKNKKQKQKQKSNKTKLKIKQKYLEVKCA